MGVWHLCYIHLLQKLKYLTAIFDGLKISIKETYHQHSFLDHDIHVS